MILSKSWKREVSMRQYIHQLNVLRLLTRNENGSTILIAMIILLLLTIIGISATNTTQIELKIAGNEKIYRQNMNLAEAAVNVGVQQISELNGEADGEELQQLVPDRSSLDWMNGSTIDFTDPLKWKYDPTEKTVDNDDTIDNSEILSFNTNCRYAVKYENQQLGSSLKSGDVSINLYSIYGLSQNNGGEVLIVVGSKKPVQNL